MLHRSNAECTVMAITITICNVTGCKGGGHGQARAKPQGEAALTPAERQARYRAALQAGTPAMRYRKPGDRRSRPQRWKDAVAELVEL